MSVWLAPHYHGAAPITVRIQSTLIGRRSCCVKACHALPYRLLTGFSLVSPARPKFAMFGTEQTTFRRRFCLGFTLAAAMTAWSSFDIHTVNASCGDYVMVGGHGHAPHTGHSSPGVPTCHGPHCQKQAPLPFGPTKGLVDAPSSDAALCCASACSARPSLSRLNFEEILSLADGHTWPLLRPPSR